MPPCIVAPLRFLALSCVLALSLVATSAKSSPQSPNGLLFKEYDPPYPSTTIRPDLLPPAPFAPPCLCDIPGVKATKVLIDSPARRAGLKPGDVIEAVDGHEVVNCWHLSKLLELTWGIAHVTVIDGDTHHRHTITIFPIHGKIGIYGRKRLSLMAVPIKL